MENMENRNEEMIVTSEPAPASDATASVGTPTGGKKGRGKKSQGPLTEREIYNNKIHDIGRLFTWISLGLIALVPVIYCVSEKVLPDWTAFAKCIPFLLGYLAVGLVEAVSYAPLMGTGGQYMSFITGNVSNLKLPCALNAQKITGVKQGSEEQEIVTTISIAVSSIVTTLVIIIGLIPLILLQEQIVDLLKPVSPYVIPAIFGGLTLVLIASYFKIAIIPFVVCILVCVVGNLIGKGSALSQSTMVIVGMAISAISTTILYKLKKI